MANKTSPITISHENIQVGAEFRTSTLDAIFYKSGFCEQDLGCANHGIGKYLLVYENHESGSGNILSFLLTGTIGGEYCWKCVYSDFQNPVC